MSSNFDLFMTQKEISHRSGISQQMISLLINGDRTPSVKTAEKLEDATGICREAWLWPARHYNPYIPFDDGLQCMFCHRRVRRIEMFAEKISDYLDKNPTLVALQEAIDGMYEFGGYKTDNIYFGMSKITDKGAIKLAAAGYQWPLRDMPFVPLVDYLPWTFRAIKGGNNIFAPNAEALYRQIPADKDLETTRRYHLISEYCIVNTSSVFFILSFKTYLNITQEMVQAIESLLTSPGFKKVISTI